MVKLPKREGGPLHIIKEFAPREPGVERSAGRLIVRATQYGSRLSRFDELFDIMAADALAFEPPIELDRDDVEIVRYGGQSYSRTFGIEVTIPEGHVVSAGYSCIAQPELTA